MAQANGLVAAYSFDEGLGTTIADASGNGNAGTIGAATWITTGRYGSALSFNGTTAKVTINDSPSLDLTTGMSLEAWVYATAEGGWREVIYKGPDDIYYLMGSSSDNTPALGGTFAAGALHGTGSLPLNTWTHLAGTYDGATMRLYVNGGQVASRAETGPIATSTGMLTIGGDPFYEQYFEGYIDEVRVYNRALDVTEIQADMNTSIGNPPPPGLSISPGVAALTFTRTQQFTANYGNIVWRVDGIIGGSASSGTITDSGLYTPPAVVGTHTVTVETPDPLAPASATVHVVNHPGIFTRHVDNLRVGANLNETVLTPANVTLATFGKLHTYPIDGLSFSSPLYVANVSIPGQGFHNVVYVATEHNSVYAFDAEGLAGAPLWHVSFLKPGVTTVPCADVGECGDIPNEIGISSTPVIDPATGTLYVVAKTKEGGAYFQRLHALDIATGAEKLGGPVVLQATVPGTGTGSQDGQLPFSALRQNQRPALLLNNGVIYIASASHGDVQPYHGWVLGYNATTLQQTFAFCATPDNEGGGIWQGGGGLAADAAGNVYFATGDGTFTADEGGVDYGDSFVKITPTGVVLDYFTPHDQLVLDQFNLDLCGGGVLLLPDQPGPHPRLLIGAGKNETIYVVDRDNMGHFRPDNDSHAVQALPNIFPNGTPEPGNIITPVYFNGTVYFSPVADNLQAFRLNNGLLPSAPTSRSAEVYSMPGGTLAISANGTNNGILWAVQRNGWTAPGALYAYDAADLGTVLYHSDQAGARDTLDIAAKYTVPIIVNGKVFVVTLGGLSIYGSISAGTIVAPAPPGLVTPANGATSVSTTPTLTWNPSSGATSYHLQVSTDPGFATMVIEQSNILTTSYAVTGLVGTLYYWRVSASNSGGNSAFSAAFSFTATTPPVPPPAPLLAAPTNGAAEITISPTLVWNLSTGAASYRLEVSTDPGFATTVVSQGDIATTSYPVAGLAQNTLYHWRVSASNSGGTSPYSTVWSFTTVFLPDGAALYGQHCASCHRPLATSTKHDRTASQIQAAIDSNRGGVMGSPEFRALTPLEVEAIAAALVTPPTQPVLASPADGLTGLSVNPTLMWNAAARATSYRVQVSTDVGFATTAVDQSNLTTTSFAASGLVANTRHYWRVNAANSGGTSAYSTTRSFTTAPAGISLVAAYAFDEGTGTTVRDASANGNEGAIGTATWTSSGRYGKALSFNGTSAKVTINASASLDLTTAMTLEAWVYPTAVGGWRDVIYKGPDDTYFLAGSSDDSTPALGGAFALSTVRGTTSLPLGTWTHLAGTYDGSTMKLYVNGALRGSQAQTGLIHTSTGALTIGGDGVYGQYWAGNIDEVRIYNRALNAGEIQTDMNTPVSAAANTAPTISDLGNRIINEDAATSAMTFNVGDTETAAANLSVTGSSSDTTLVPNANLVFGGSGSNRTVTVSPAPNQSGTATLTVRVSDGQLSASDTFVLTVTPVNDAPTISDIADQNTSSATAAGPIGFTVGDVETPAGSLTLSGASSNPTLVPPANIAFGGSGSDRTVTVSPVAGRAGSATITVSVSDGELTASSQFAVIVSPRFAATRSFTNATALTIPDEGAATPYPSIVNVAGMTGTVRNMTITLHGLTHTFPDDLDILLVGPTGQKVVLFSDVGGASGINGLTQTLSDGAASALPDVEMLLSGTFRPTNIGQDDSFIPPAPAGPYATVLSAFNGLPADGAWALYLSDDRPDNQGILAGGWSVTLTTVSTTAAPPRLSLTLLGSGEGAQVLLRIEGQSWVTYVVEASEDLAFWTPIGEASDGTGVSLFTDVEATGHNRRFYRVSQNP